MTSHYLDITLRPDAELSPPQLLGALCDHLHLALVRARTSEVGVSFPGYRLAPRTLGAVLRLHGSPAALGQLLPADWLQGMRDHVRLGTIAPVPDGAQHRALQRRQFKTSVARLRRRRMRRKAETADEAAVAIPASVERRPDLPYLQLHSRSTRQPFRLFIALGPLQANATAGLFDSHGLGGPATVPWF